MLNSGTRRNYIDTPSVSQPIKTISSEDLNVVDLDELFQESAKTTLTEEEENLALEEFLSGFSFNEEDFENVIEEDIYIYDEAFLEKVLKRKKLKFTKDDISKLNKRIFSKVGRRGYETAGTDNQ